MTERVEWLLASGYILPMLWNIYHALLKTQSGAVVCGHVLSAFRWSHPLLLAPTEDEEKMKKPLVIIDLIT